MKTWKVFSFGLLLVLLLGFTLKRGPSGPEETITVFGIEDALTAGFCASNEFSHNTDVACTGDYTKHYVTDAWTVTRISAVVGGIPFDGNEGCDVDVDFAGSTTATFLFGSTSLRAAGDTDTTTALTDNTLAAGDIIVVRHDTPADTDQCPNGDGGGYGLCACQAANVMYQVRIYGVRQ